MKRFYETLPEGERLAIDVAFQRVADTLKGNGHCAGMSEEAERLVDAIAEYMRESAAADGDGASFFPITQG